MILVVVWQAVAVLSDRTKNLALAAVAVIALVLTVYAVALRPGPKNTPAAGLPAAAVTASPSAAAGKTAAIFFGDSYFNGADGVPASNSMAAVAAQQLGVVPYIGGHGGIGFVTADPSTATGNYVSLVNSGRLSGLVTNPAAVSLVVIEGGLNDGDRRRSAVLAGVKTVLASAKRTFPKAKIFLLGPVHPAGQVTAALTRVEQAESEGAKAEGVPFLSAAAWVTPANRSQIIDSLGIHPSANGHKILGRLLADALKARGV